MSGWSGKLSSSAYFSIGFILPYPLHLTKAPDFEPAERNAPLTGTSRVLESLKAGKRLPEAQFSNMSLAPKNQKSVYGMFKKTNSKSEETISATKDAA